MGKDRDKGFRGSKYNPSSSGEAGTLMGSQSSGFIGFSAFTTNLTNATDPDYYQVEPEYRVLLKKLQKKDSVSRIKGLEELLLLFSKINIESSEFNVSSISPLMNAWEFMYKRLVNDDDRRVRDLANQCLGAIGSRIGKHLGPHVKSLLGPWILAICDQKDQINSSALNSFQNIFPEKKRKDVFKFGHDEALTYLCENLQETPQTIGDNKSNNQDILQERYERCISNSLLAIEYLINQTSTNDTAAATTTSTTTTSTTNTEIYEKIFEAQFFSFFQSKSSIIRKTAYRVLSTIIKKVPGYVDKNFKDFSSKILGLFSEKDSSTHLYMWDAIISFLKSYNDKAWSNVDVRKHVLPRLWAFFRAGCYGSYELSYPSILPLLTFIPNSVVIGNVTSSESSEINIGFFKEFFNNLEKGLEIVDTQRQYGNPNNPERPSNLLLSCYLECLVYSSKKWGQSYATTVNTYLLDSLLSNLYKDYFTCQNLSFSEKLFIEKLIESTNKISNISELNQLKIQELFKNSNFLNNLFIKKLVIQETSSGISEPATTTTTTTTTTSPLLSKKEEKLIEPISNETLYSRLNSFLKSKNIGSGSGGVLESFIKKLFSLSCNHLNDNDNDIQELSIKIIDLILNNFKINQLFSNSNEIQSFLNETILTNLKKLSDDNTTTTTTTTTNTSVVPLINNLISISITLLSSINDNEIIKLNWSNILQIFSKSSTPSTTAIENKKYLIHLINFSNGKLNRDVLSNSILDSMVMNEICNSSTSSPLSTNKENEKLIQALLFSGNNNNEYLPIISNESIEKLINWLFNQLVELMETIQMNLLLEFNIDYLVELSRLIFLIPLSEEEEEEVATSGGGIQVLVKKLLIQWTKFNIEINHRSNLSNYCSTCKPIESFLFSNNNNDISNSILSILIDYVENSELVNGDPNLDYLSSCTIKLINNSGGVGSGHSSINESYSYLIKRFISNQLVINSINQIKISWFRYNMITPFYLLNNIESSSASTGSDQDITSTTTPTLFKILIFNFKIIESFGFNKFIEISNNTTTLNSIDNNIKLLLLNLVFINGDNNLPTSSVSSTETTTTTSSFNQIRNYIELKSFELINQFIESLFKYYGGSGQEIFKSNWFKEIINNIGSNTNGGVYSIILKLFIDYIEMDNNNKNYKSSLLSSISIPSPSNTIESIKELNLIQVLLPILSNEIIEEFKENSLLKISNLSSSIPNNLMNVSIQLSLISSIILLKQHHQSHNQQQQAADNSSVIILNDKEWLILLNSIQMIQQWNSRIKLMKQQDPQLEITFFKEMEISLLNYLLLIVQYSCNKEIYLSNNQSLLIQSLLSIWLSNSKSILLSDSVTTTLKQEQYKSLIEYQSLKLYNNLISNNNNNMKFIIPGIADQFQIDHSILVLNNWLDKVNGNQGKSSDASYSLELYSNTFEKMTNEIKFKISLTKLDSLIQLVSNGGSGVQKGNVQKTSYSILESYFVNENTQLVKSFLLEEASDDHQDDEKVEYIVVSSVFEKLLIDFENTWIPMKKNKNNSIINSKAVGQLILWNLLLRNYSILDLNKRSVINGWLNNDQKVIHLLNNIFQFANKDELPNLDYNQFPFKLIEQQQQQANASATTGVTTTSPSYSIIQQLCSHCIFSLVNYLPSMVRRWADENSTNSKMNQSIQNYITRFISPIIIQNEISRVNAYREPTPSTTGEENNFQVKGLVSSREVTASYEKDEMTIALVLSIPETYPLRVLTVEFSKRLGVSESQWRQWLLSMTSLLLTQDGTVLDACLLWKSSLDKHFQGVEVCPICYSMFHNGTIPKFQCKTCKNKFHSGCIYKWLKTSHKSNCPLCQTELN